MALLTGISTLSTIVGATVAIIIAVAVLSFTMVEPADVKYNLRARPIKGKKR